MLGYKFHLKNSKSNHGFSLIELMIVVGIIGVLAAVGVPVYSKFQAKARQSEVKTNLAWLFSTEKAFFAEWNGYTINVATLGFLVEGGALRYNYGFPGMANCVNYNAPNIGMPSESIPSLKVRADQNLSAGSAFYNAMDLTFTPSVGGAACDNTVSAQAFTALGWGDPNSQPNPTAASVDVWSINEMKSTSQVRSGIR